MGELLFFICFILYFKLYFIVYGITVVPILPSLTPPSNAPPQFPQVIPTPCIYVLWLWLCSLCCTIHPCNYSVTTNLCLIPSPFSSIPLTILSSGNHQDVLWLWLMWVSGLSVVPWIKRLPVWFPVRAHARLWARSPVGGMQEATNWCFYWTLMFLPLFLPSLLSLFENKWIKYLKKHSLWSWFCFCSACLFILFFYIQLLIDMYLLPF